MRQYEGRRRMCKKLEAYGWSGTDSNAQADVPRRAGRGTAAAGWRRRTGRLRRKNLCPAYRRAVLGPRLEALVV